MKQFYIRKGLSGIYGDHIFLHIDVVRDMLKGTHCFLGQLPHSTIRTVRETDSRHPIAEVLVENCLWGGSDKRFDDWFGYEVSITGEGQTQMANIVKVLTSEGFTQLSSCPW